MLKYILYGAVVISANCFGMEKKLSEDPKQDLARRNYYIQQNYYGLLPTLIPIPIDMAHIWQQPIDPQIPPFRCVLRYYLR